MIKKTNKKEMRIIFLFGIFVLIIISLSVSLDAQQESLYCAEKTISGAYCQMVSLNQVNTNFKSQPTSCERTTYCSTGTCVNTATGSCISGPQATCNSSLGGYFYNEPKEDVSQCKIGCCLLGDEAAINERTRCDVLGKDYNVEAVFRQDITDENVCLSMAGADEKGACVFETNRGRECKHETRGECQKSGGEFSEGFLCTNPALGTICAKTKQTSCVDGKNEVYFIDSCRNNANVYDASKINDVLYWSYFAGYQGVEASSGDKRGNINSKTNGMCDYIQGSTCARYDRTIDGSANKPTYGDFICRDLSCKSNALTQNIKRQHGESWCSEPLTNFENSNPGQLSYLLYCYNGEVGYELCSPFRNQLCSQNATSKSASCIPNKWQDCALQTSVEDCESIDRDCKVVYGAGFYQEYGGDNLIKDRDGNMIKASCVPKYTPASKFWEINGTIQNLIYEETGNPLSLCNTASYICKIHYTQQIAYISDFRADLPDKDCVDACKNNGNPESYCNTACTPECFAENLGSANDNVRIRDYWAESAQNLCVSVGDCGVSANYLNKDGKNRWRDLFIGDKIKWDTLPNALKRR